MENMKDFEIFQEIWKTQPITEIPDAKSILIKAKEVRQKMGRQILLQVLSLLVSSAVIVWVYVAIDFKVVTTLLGILFLVGTIFLYSFLRLFQFFKLQKINFIESPKLVLLDLEKYYVLQQKVVTKYTFWYFIWINAGMFLYFIEVLAPMVLWGKIVVFLVYFFWMFYAYFVLGKKQKEKENAKIVQMIEDIKRLESNIAE